MVAGLEGGVEVGAPGPLPGPGQGHHLGVGGPGAGVVPGIDLELAAAFQSKPGPLLAANYAAPNSVVFPSLGRDLSGGASNVTVNLIAPGSLYGDRINQLDLNGNFIIADLVWIGASWRTTEQVITGHLQVNISQQLMLGLSYDLPAGRMNKYSNGSSEIILRYEFGSKVSASNPRYF